jgi:hypothetical protein
MASERDERGPTMTMHCDLAGLLANAAEQIRGRQRGRRDYYAGALDDVAAHVRDVRAGRATLAEFAALYWLVPAADDDANPDEAADPNDFKW